MRPYTSKLFSIIPNLPAPALSARAKIGTQNASFGNRKMNNYGRLALHKEWFHLRGNYHVSVVLL